MLDSIALRLGLVLLLLGLPAAVMLWPSAHSEDPPPQRKPRIVHAATVEETSLTERIRVPCSVEAPHFVRLCAEVAGQVQWAGPDEGDVVAAGDALVKIDPARFHAAVNRARAALAWAKLRSNRAERLVESEAVSREKLDETIPALAAAQAELDVASVDLAKATIASPLAGRVERRYVNAGDYVRVGTCVADVVSVREVEIVFEIPERDIPHVRPDNAVALEFDQLGDPERGEPHRLNATVTAVADTADPRTRTYTVRVRLANPGDRLKPGMLGRATLARLTRRGIVAVPVSALLSRQGRHTVWVLEEGRAREREVRLGVTDGKRVQIVEGLKPGDRLIVTRAREIVDGLSVKVAEEKRP
jgi:membrane fusion protein (multidrug efflux system)